MIKKYMKSIVIGCVATISFIGLHNTAVEAITEYPAVKEERLWEPGQQSDVTIAEIKEEDTRSFNWNFTEDILQIPDKQQVLDLQTTKAILGITKDTEEKEPEHKDIKEKEPEQQGISISNEEKDLFARLVEAEAKGESYEGKVAVATVVLNRVESSQFPDTVTGVIEQTVGGTYAFSPVQNGEIHNSASDEAIKAVEEALTRKDRLNNSIYFYNPDIATDNWIRSREVVKTIDNHVFAK